MDSCVPSYPAVLLILKVSNETLQEIGGHNLCTICSSIHPSIHLSSTSLSSISHPSLLPCQFDHSFVEVHRVRRFHFQPRHHELVSLEDLSQSPKKTGFSPICSAQSTCNYSTTHSCWTCDGEILPHAAIQVR